MRIKVKLENAVYSENYDRKVVGTMIMGTTIGSKNCNN